ncbi:MAG TPA: ABC transporter ATP-binding protein [Chthonomonadaceae bacterium]|nr:ABC transporter ATP-binding protein [Chthonomonadaceae bacterium]
MSSKDLAISVQGLSKAYTLVHNTESHTRAAEALLYKLKNPFRSAERTEEFWALKDVSFDIAQGEVVGIIGRNGAGKSTLLKIISRVTAPTEGEIRLYGRVGSLLEVGTGFHPELTGRENIFMNGSILGMTRREIARKFDAIVDFSGVEAFLDTPVKRYSSGMYVRLAFAVAANLEPEILIVDEVLAVGDAEFQKKCLGKMSEVAGQGRTVLFVSHNMPTVLNLCSRVLMLKEGHIALEGPGEEVVAEYMRQVIRGGAEVGLDQHPGRTPGSEKILKALGLRNKSGAPATSLRMGEDFSLEMHYDAGRPLSSPRCGIGIYNHLGIRVVSFATFFDGDYRAPEWSQAGTLRCLVNGVHFTPGLYFVTVTFGDAHSDLDRVEQASSFEVTPWDVFQTGVIPRPDQGVVYAPCQQWEQEEAGS